MPKTPDPEETLDAFLKGLLKLSIPEGWVVVRTPDGLSERGFVISNGDRRLQFMAKVSHSANGFWGLTPAQAAEIASNGGPALVLLTGPYAGYFIPGSKFRLLRPELSVAAGGGIKVNEGRLRHQERFNTLMRLWSLLRDSATDSK